MNTITPTSFLAVHTPKAIRAGHPSDRVFIVVGSYKEGRGIRYVAYKATIVKPGVISHPALSEPIVIRRTPKFKRTLMDAVPSNPDLVQPTADFRMDSFYKEVDIGFLLTMVPANAAQDPSPSAVQVLAQKLTKLGLTADQIELLFKQSAAVAREMRKQAK